MIFGLRRFSVLIVFQGGLLAALGVGPSRVWGQEIQPGFWIGLEETIARAIETDKSYLSKKAEWLSSDMRMEDLRRRGGWNLEILGRDEGLRGERRENRDISRGRDSLDQRGLLLESERFVEFGLVRKFWEEQRQTRSDVSDERIGQLDSAANLMVDLGDAAERAAVAYLEVYYGGRKRERIESLIANQEEDLRLLQARRAQEEILDDRVLDVRALLAETRGRLLEVDLALDRNLAELRSIWGIPDLQAEDLAEPSIEESTRFVAAGPDELIGIATESRFDFQAAKAALEEQKSARKLAPEKPEIEFGMLGRYGSYDRDYLDEGRDDSTLDLQFELGLVVPLSLATRNEFRVRRHEMMTQARVLDLEALRGELRREVRAARDAHLLAEEAVKIEKLKLAKEEEAERVTRLTALTLPESLDVPPDAATREAKNSVLLAQLDLIAAKQEAMLSRIELLAAIGRLAPAPGTGPSPSLWKEN